ncbi:ANTAR domain-containing protein [Streptomyces sp. NPDC052496]|uniref:ANTAR domain-containing protein n=1 Tax=Streptomyces sp. NPDC052496 TaxID=3154951 RepID=UPI0034138C88
MPEAAHWARLPADPPAGGGDGGTPAASSPELPRIEILQNGDRTRVTVRGELDLDACAGIEHELREALGRSRRGVDLDLDAVPFCDCSGLNMLLRLRLRAVAQDKTVGIVTGSRAVERLLALAGARELFPPAEPNPNGRPAPGAYPPPDLHLNHAPHDGHVTFTSVDGSTPDEDASRGLPREVAQLRRAMQTRPAIDLARGILMATFTLTPEAAWSVLVSVSQNSNTKLHRLAQNLVDSVQGSALPEAIQEHLGAAVARAKAASTVPAQPGAAADRHTAPEPWRAAPGGE